MRLVVDSSAIIALLRQEPGYRAVAHLMASTEAMAISAATWLETSIVVERTNSPALTREWALLERTQPFHVHDVTAAQAAIAREAYRDFGKGRGHPAQLNFGDCFAYALAVDLRLPLLAVGDDFRRTGIDVVP